VHRGRLSALLATLKPLDEPFPDVDEGVPPLDDVRL
jgi:antitoxin VapB